MANTTNMSFRVDKNLKIRADKLFKSLGMNTSVAINMFLTQCVRDQAIPFKPTALDPEPNDELKHALQEADDIASGKIKVKSYRNVNKMFEDILSED